MPDTTYSLGPLWSEIRAELRTSREARAARKALRRELESYTSPSDLNDLDAMLTRYTEDQTAEIRSILSERRAA
jgi:hypothetical protein